MIYIPWLVFLAAVLWMIREGTQAKAEYLRRKAEMEKTKPDLAKSIEALSSHGSGQGQAPELAGALAGSQKVVTGFRQQGRGEWN
jgi:hypothetical protein